MYPRSSWATRKESGLLEINWPTMKGSLVGFGLGVAGAGAMLAVGSLLGGIDRVPVVNQGSADFFSYISNIGDIDFTGNLDKVGGLAGAVYGHVRSGVKLDKHLEPERFTTLPFSYWPERDGKGARSKIGSADWRPE